MERKACADCGSLSLQSEVSCWACCGMNFVSPGGDIPAERTIAIPSFGEQTIAWSAVRRPWPYTPYALAGAAALLLGVGGFWLGRATLPAPVTVKPSRVEIQPQPLPTPPTVLAVQPFQASPAMAAAAIVAGPPPATVTIRSVTRPLPGSTAGPGTPISAPNTPPRMPVMLPASAQTASVVSRSQVVGPPAAAPPGASLAITPSGSQAIVQLRNDDSVPVEITVIGTDNSRILIAPGDTVPVPLSAGSYQLRASSKGAGSAQSSLAVAVNHSYSLVVSRKRDGGAETLVLLEPLLDSHSG